MNKKLTLLMDEVLIEHAKKHAEETGKSVSKMFADFVTALDSLEASKQLDAENALDMDTLLPTTRALLGMLKTEGKDGYGQAYHCHLEEKYR